MQDPLTRRDLIMGGSAICAGALLAAGVAAGTADTSTTTQATNAATRTMGVQAKDTAVVIIDPQNDVLTDKGTSWGVLGASVTENQTVENIERLFKSAKAGGYEVIISPHYFYPTDYGWTHDGPLESVEVQTRTFARRGPLTLEGFRQSGADWVERFRPYIEDGRTIICSPHKVFGPQTNDVVLQLGKRGLTKIILCGMIANLCVESHLREFLEVGLEIAVVKDATAGPRHPEWGDGYQAAVTNYRYLAHALWTTTQALEHMG